MVIWQVDPAPLQSPDQLVRCMPGAGVEVRVTLEPYLKLLLQMPGQLIPGADTLLTTVPEPEILTVRS